MAKRGAGEASIYQRKSDGKWCASVHLGYWGGKRRRKVVYGDTRFEVREKLQSIQTQQSQGLPIQTDERATIPQFLESWLEHVRPRLRESAFRAYNARVNRWVVELDRVRLTKLTPQRVNKALQRFEDSGLTPTTVNHLRATLRIALADAQRWGIVHRNVAALATPRRIEDREAAVLSPEQAKALLDGTEGMEHALYATTMACGLRISEARGLRWQDVDIEGRQLYVRVQLQRRGGEWVHTEPKSRQSKRTLSLPTFAAEALRAWRQAQREQRLKAGKRWANAERDLVFTTPTGQPLADSSVNRHLREDLERLGLPVGTFHMLRHSCASLLLAYDVPMKTIQHTLGHSQIGLTMNTYSHLQPAAQREAADSLDRWYGASSV